MMYWYYVVWFIIAVIAIAVLSVFIGFFIKLALLLALLAFAYYWFRKAISHHHRKGPWH